MTLEEMLRGSPLRQQRMADDNAISLAGMLARQGAGTVRQDPSLMQNIGCAIADYAVPDRYLPSSVMEPRLDMSQLEALRGTPVDMADVPDPVPMLMDTMPMAGIPAWHGSPHKFSKFDMSKIGTGEGAQAYGHGLYAAENPAVAKDYAEVLGERMDSRISGGGTDVDIPRWLANAIDSGQMSIDDAIKDWSGRALEQRGIMKTGQQPWIAEGNAIRLEKETEALKQLKEHGSHEIDKRQHLYKVDIPDDQIAKMLDWDKPLSEQPMVRETLEANNIPYKPTDTGQEFYTNLAHRHGTREMASKIISGQPAGVKYVEHDGVQYSIIPQKGGYKFVEVLPDGRLWKSGEVYTENGINSLLIQRSKTHGTQIPTDMLFKETPKQTSIKGIKYLDQGSRQGGKGTSNFVLFSDDIAKILERNDQPIGDLAEELLGK